MAEVILMPRLSDTMTEGVIAAWHKKVGDVVKKGDLLAEIETDKATMELESYKDGTLLHIGTDKGGKLQVNDLLAIIGNKGEDVTGLIKGSDQSSSNKQQPATSNQQPNVILSKEKDEPVEGKQPASADASAGKQATSNQQQKTSNQPATSNQQPATTRHPEPVEGQQQVMDISKMDEVVLMPRLSDTMEEGVIAAWHKNVGDTVKKGEVLAEIETDKATMELESYKNGTLLHIGAQKGEKVAVNSLLAIIGDKSKVDVNAIVAAAKGSSGAQQPATSRHPEPVEGKQPATSNQQQAASSQPEPVEGKQQEQQSLSSENGRIKASPLAKKLAAEKGIDLSKIHGTGDGGRITKADIDNYKELPQEKTVQKAEQKAGTMQPIASFTPGEEGFTDITVSQMRKVIARRLSESKFGSPHFYLTMEINMDNAIASRTQMNEISPVKISFNDMIVKAAAIALRQHPGVNASWMNDHIRQYKHIHIGVAVAIEDGLIVPVIRFADQKSLSQIAAESKELSTKARNKKLQPQEFTGNTFTVSNLGMMDIDEFTAIINPPDSCIMAVGRIKEIVVRKKTEGENGSDSFGVSNVMKITLSCDHRSVDGAMGAAFLQTFKKYLENPVTMLV